MLATKVIVCLGIFLIQFSSLTASPSWISNAPRALFGLASSASASASAPPSPVSYVADFRRKSAKATQQQEEKVGADSLPLDENVNEGSAENSNNEASPSLIQKKIVKILAKLRLIAQIKNAYHYKPEEEENSNEDETNSTMPSTKNETKSDPKSSVNITILEHIQQIPPSSGASKIKSLPPLEVDLEVEQITDKTQDTKIQKNEKVREQERGPLGALGIFFAELLGSIVGLTYGAAVHFGAGGQSPVTLSTSEGL